MDRQDVARWLDRYAEAWQTYDQDLIGSLFSDDAQYRYHPWDEPVVGAAAITQDWLVNRDSSGTYEGSYEPWAVEGSRAVGVGTSRYWGDGGDRTYHNAFLLEFDAAGRCSLFTELYLQQG